MRVFIAPTEVILAAFGQPAYDSHVILWRWHQYTHLVPEHLWRKPR